MWASLWMIREAGVDYDPFEIYSEDNTLFTIKLIHGGEFMNSPNRKYMNGKSCYIDCCCTEDFGVDVLVEMTKSVGYPCDMVFYYHFRLPDGDLDTGLRELATNASVDRFCSLATQYKVMEVYVQHWWSKISTFMVEHEERQRLQQPVVVECNDPLRQPDLQSDSDIEEEIDQLLEGLEVKVKGKTPIDANESISLVKVKLDRERVEIVDTKQDENMVEDQQDDGDEKQYDSDEEEDDSDEKGDEFGSEQDDSEDSDYIVDPDNMVEDPEVDMKHFRSAVDDVEDDEELHHNVDIHADDLHVDLDDFDSLSEHEEDENEPRQLRKDKKGEEKSFHPFKVGDLFEDREEIKLIIKEHAVESRRQLHIVKNEHLRFRVVCRGHNPVFTSGESSQTHGGPPKKKKTAPRKKPTKGGGQISNIKKPTTPRKKYPKPTCPWAVQISRPTVNDLWEMQNVFHGRLIGMMKHYQGIPPYYIQDEEPFSLVNPSLRRNLVLDRWRNYIFDCQVLGSGMVLFKNYLTLKGQVDIVNICQKGAMGPGGFYQPSNRSGDKLRLRMMCFGRNWDPITRYEKRYRSDGSEAPPLPYELISLAENAIKDAQWHQDELPSMCPDICIANFYTSYGQLGLHQDCDERPRSLRKGLPVISISIGSSAEFEYGHSEDVNKLDTVLLESGDVLIFGGESRLIFHGVRRIVQETVPSQLLQETGLIPGRLNLTLRQV